MHVCIVFGYIVNVDVCTVYRCRYRNVHVGTVYRCVCMSVYVCIVCRCGYVSVEEHRVNGQLYITVVSG